MKGRFFGEFSEVPTEPVINITPLIDVVFVLLISFIVIAPLLELDRIELAQGGRLISHVSMHPDHVSGLQIHVYQDNTISVNGVVTPLASLSQVVGNIREKNEHIKPVLFQDRRAHFGTYQNVKNVLESLGYQELDIVLDPS